MAYYATYNSRADLINGSRGFRNTWEIVRCGTAAKRARFIAEWANMDARTVTRAEAEAIYRDGYRSTGAAVPAGGLFGGAGGYDRRVEDADEMMAPL